MDLTTVDLQVFVVFITLVFVVSLWAGRREHSSEDYFLAGRSLGWGLIGFSLIASNISTEHFVGMAGQAFGRVGLAIASYACLKLLIPFIIVMPGIMAFQLYGDSIANPGESPHQILFTAIPD
jgi:SSS family solute:Na+ symporter